MFFSFHLSTNASVISTFLVLKITKITSSFKHQMKDEEIQGIRYFEKGNFEKIE